MQPADAPKASRRGERADLGPGIPIDFFTVHTISFRVFNGVSRNFQVFDPLDFIAELTQHIPECPPLGIRPRPAGRRRQGRGSAQR